MYKSTEKFLFPFLYPNKESQRFSERRTGGIYQSIILNTVPVASTSVPFSEAYDHGNLQMMH